MPKVQHMVLLKFKPETDDNTVADIFAQIAQLQELVPGIERYSGGPYASPEGLNKGFTHGFVMTFSSPEARNAYLPHLDHQRVKDQILAAVDDAVAFDFED